MEKRNLNISFYKAGGTLATRLNVPIPWVKKLGITPEEKGIEMIFDEEKEEIIIRKKK
ncbi:AbrB/MazE/SpoVT family DNA-binding domain-containing protein [Fusobacterium sp. HC1336]|uniref:AbrB/MazE/SpoVT family DNA-binding domain-containing protein n=1 Tax=Fusobacterium sp. HC1336 TaxID=3171169 RepID=UPI003F257237